MPSTVNPLPAVARPEVTSSTPDGQQESGSCATSADVPMDVTTGQGVEIVAGRHAPALSSVQLTTHPVSGHPIVSVNQGAWAANSTNLERHANIFSVNQTVAGPDLLIPGGSKAIASPDPQTLKSIKKLEARIRCAQHNDVSILITISPATSLMA